MDFYDVVDQVANLLQQRGRLTYQSLKLQFKLDNETLEAVKDELLFAHPAAAEDGRGIVWTGDAEHEPAVSSLTQRQDRDPASYTPQHLAEKILITRSALEGERKQVTVLFCDLACARRQWDAAEGWLQQTLPLSQTIGNPTQLWQTYRALGEFHTEAKRPEPARQSYQAARDVIDRVKANVQTPALGGGLQHSPVIQQVYDLSGPA